jgi:hypothetical protein
VTLKDDGPLLGASAFAGIGIRFASIRPIRDFIAVDPDPDVRPGRDDRFCKPMPVVGIHQPRIDTPENPAGSTIHRVGAISVFELILNLAFISIH